MKSALRFTVLSAVVGLALSVSTAEAAKGVKKGGPKPAKPAAHHSHKKLAEHHARMKPAEHHASVKPVEHPPSVKPIEHPPNVKPIEHTKRGRVVRHKPRNHESRHAGPISPANQQMIQKLEAIRATLNGADHDYDGRRAAAVSQISNMIHMLEHGKAHPNAGMHFVAGRHRSELQGMSDSQLKQALGELQGLPAPTGPHAAKMQAELAKTITDIQSALKLK